MIPSAMLHNEVSVKDHGFHLRQVVVVPIEVSPSSLDHADFGVGELVDCLVKEFRVWNKVRVENSDEFASGNVQASFECTGLESCAIVSMQVMNIDALLAQRFNRFTSDVLRFIGRVVQKLNFQKFGGIVDLGYRLDQSLNYKHLVIDGQLDGDRRQRRKSGWLGYTLFVSQIQIDQLIAMQPVNCQDDQDHEIRDEHKHVKAVQDVVLARLVEKLFVRTRWNEEMLQVLKEALGQELQSNHKSPVEQSLES